MSNQLTHCLSFIQHSGSISSSSWITSIVFIPSYEKQTGTPCQVPRTHVINQLSLRLLGSEQFFWLIFTVWKYFISLPGCFLVTLPHSDFPQTPPCSTSVLKAFLLKTNSNNTSVRNKLYNDTEFKTIQRVLVSFCWQPAQPVFSRPQHVDWMFKNYTTHK